MKDFQNRLGFAQIWRDLELDAAQSVLKILKAETCHPSTHREMASVLFALAMCIIAESAVMVQKNEYESTGCTGRVVKTEYMTASCSASGSGYYTMTCNSTGVTMNYFSDNACTSSTGQSASYALDSCRDDNDKYVSCAEMDVVTVNFYSTACSAEFLQGAFSLPVGCRATGGMENGQARLQSQSVQISGNNLVSKSFTGSFWVASNIMKLYETPKKHRHIMSE